MDGRAVTLQEAWQAEAGSTRLSGWPGSPGCPRRRSPMRLQHGRTHRCADTLPDASGASGPSGAADTPGSARCARTPAVLPASAYAHFLLRNAARGVFGCCTQSDAPKDNGHIDAFFVQRFFVLVNFGVREQSNCRMCINSAPDPQTSRTAADFSPGHFPISALKTQAAKWCTQPPHGRAVHQIYALNTVFFLVHHDSMHTGTGDMV